MKSEGHYITSCSNETVSYLQSTGRDRWTGSYLQVTATRILLLSCLKVQMEVIARSDGTLSDTVHTEITETVRLEGINDKKSNG